MMTKKELMKVAFSLQKIAMLVNDSTLKKISEHLKTIEDIVSRVEVIDEEESKND